MKKYKGDHFHLVFDDPPEIRPEGSRYAIHIAYVHAPVLLILSFFSSMWKNCCTVDSTLERMPVSAPGPRPVIQSDPVTEDTFHVLLRHVPFGPVDVVYDVLVDPFREGGLTLRLDLLAVERRVPVPSRPSSYRCSAALCRAMFQWGETSSTITTRFALPL